MTRGAHNIVNLGQTHTHIMKDLMALEACRQAVPIRLPVEMELITTPLRWQE